MIQINRGLKLISVPFTAERFAGDVNMVSTSIRLNVVLQDDNCGEITTDETTATSSIDFTQSEPSVLLPGVQRWLYAESEDAGARVKRADLHDAKITIIAKSSVLGASKTFTITLKDTACLNNAHGGIDFSDHDEDTDDMILYMQTGNVSNPTIDSVGTAPDSDNLAAYLKGFINANTNFAACMTATVESTSRNTGTNDAGYLNRGLLRLTHVFTGGWQEDSPSFELQGVIEASESTTLPSITPWYGGGVQSCFSAGDKVQNLIGCVVNNHILGGIGAIGGADKTKSHLPIIGSGEYVVGDDKGAAADYIIGLQLPYNSFTGVTAGDQARDSPQSYNAKNFIYATGYNEKDKGAVANTLDASHDFQVTNKYTGIRGTVTAAEFKYLAGSSVYEGSVTFQPIDMIVGL
jgi:hypothetical protein